MAKENYPLYEVQPFDSIKEMLELAVGDCGDKVAFRYRKGNDVVDVTYSEFQDDTFAIGTALAQLKVADKHIACIGENSYNWVCVYLTALKSSGVYVPVDKELPFGDIINVLVHSDSEVLFYTSRYEADLMANCDKLPKIKYFIGFDRESDEGKFLSFEKFKADGRRLYEEGNTDYTSMTSDPMALKLLVYTSGTTGMAKGVMLSEHNLVSSVYYGLQISTVYDTSLSVLPYHHTYEAVSGLLVSIHHHCTICINENLKTVLKNLQFYKPDFIYLVPAFVEVFYKKIWSTARQTKKEGALKVLIGVSNGLRKLGIDNRRKLFASIHESFGGNLKKIVCGGAPIRPELGEFFDSIGINLINGYGITECSPLVSANRDFFNDCATVGPILPCCKLRFDDVSADGEGEICVKGDIVMMGYYRNPTLTAEVLRDGWFSTGDYGRMNEKGQLLITGRKKNLIVLSNGKNIFPEEIENYIQAIPYVSEVIVYAIKDENNSESSLGAEVFLSEEKLAELQIVDKEAAIKRDIAKACAPMPSYKHISKIVIRDTEFEKTTSNKIKRSSALYNKKAND